MDKTMDEMTTIGIVGLIFLSFFLVIMFFTRQGVRIFKGGDDEGGSADDDGDSGADELIGSG